MKNTNKNIAKLYRLLCEAKGIQHELVSTNGKDLTEKEREQVVMIWNSLDESGKAIHSIMQLKNINYLHALSGRI
jgi:hypothetical protein